MQTELKDKNILVGICGGISAYKTAFLVRLLITQGANVRVVMTQSAKEFISPLTLSVLSKNKVIQNFSDQDGNWNNHIELAKWADVFIVAPITANSLSKFAYGQSDNILTAIYLSIEPQKVYLVPAMDVDMYNNSVTQENIEKLKVKGIKFIEPEEGELASGLWGVGRMREPEDIIRTIRTHFKKNTKLQNKKILITAGPTVEKIDPVRYISNNSSGKMGFELANAFAYLGGEVTLITGPTFENTSRDDIKVINVESAKEMFESVENFFDESDISIFAAAVADYKPKNISDQKIKKSDDSLIIELEKTIDIAKYFSTKKNENQKCIGFALETENEVENAKKKLLEKNLDAIVLNSLNDKNSGFEFDTNKITIIDKNQELSFELKSKKEVAFDITNYLIEKHL